MVYHDRIRYITKSFFFQVCILGIFAGTLFYRLGGQYNLQHMNSVRALGFVTSMSILLINMPQLHLYMLQRHTFYKHRDQRFFRTSSYVVAHCISNLPQAFTEVISPFNFLSSIVNICTYMHSKWYLILKMTTILLTSFITMTTKVV